MRESPCTHHQAAARDRAVQAVAAALLAVLLAGCRVTTRMVPTVTPPAARASPAATVAPTFTALPVVQATPTLAAKPTATVALTPSPRPTAPKSPTSAPSPSTAAPSPTKSSAPGVQVPVAGASVTLPLHVQARTGAPGQRVIVALQWRDGTRLSHPVTVLRGEDGHGLVIDSLDWNTETQPPEPPTEAATLEIRDRAGGALLSSQDVTVLSPADPAIRQIMVTWVAGNELHGISRRIPKTQRVATAAMEELLWGPTPGNLAGFTTAIPTPEEVLAFPGRRANWGPRVQVRSVTIVDGLATANFSQEMAAYGGDPRRATLIRGQVVNTLLQFPSVKQVRIAIEGKTEGVLSP